MDPYEPNPNPFLSAHLPLTLLAATAILFFLSQLGNISQGTENMRWQSTNTDKVIKNLTETSQNFDKNIEAREALVAQSEQLQKQFTELMKELDELAKAGDKDAEMIIKGYGIRVNDPPAAGAATPPAATPAAEPPANK